MATLGEKLTAKKEMTQIIQNISEDGMTQAQAEDILQHALIIYKNAKVYIDHDGHYHTDEILDLCDTCSNMVKKEYSKLFMNSISLEMMFKDDDEKQVC